MAIAELSACMKKREKDYEKSEKGGRHTCWHSHWLASFSDRLTAAVLPRLRRKKIP